MLFELLSDPHILTTFVLSGASALIPVPLVDDAVKGFSDRRALRLIAALGGRRLTQEEQALLTSPPPKGCCGCGCLFSVALYPVKRVLRKVFYFLEIKRSVDQATQALATGWLFRWAVEREIWPASGLPPEEIEVLREAIRQASSLHGVQPLELAVRKSFRGARSTMLGFARSFTGKTIEVEGELSEAVEKLEAERESELASLSERLISSLSGVSTDYFTEFTAVFQRCWENGLKDLRSSHSQVEISVQQDSAQPKTGP